MENEVKNTAGQPATEDTTGVAEQTTTATEAEATPSTVEEAKFSQAQVDELIAKRIARETKKWEKKLAEATQPQADKTDAEKMDELEKSLKEANASILSYKLSAMATEAHIKPDRAKAFIKLIDLSEVDTADDEALKDAIEETAKAYPEFVSDSENTKKGYVKAGIEKNEMDEEAKLRAEVRKLFGLK